MKDTTMTMKILGMAVALACASIPLTPTWAQAPAAKAAVAPAATQRRFDTPEAASRALADAVRAGDANALLAVVGPDSKRWLFSGDGTADREDWRRFLEAHDQKNVLAREGDSRATLLVGNDEWPFPAPLVRKDGKWAFDADAGREELVNRRVGRNELDTIQTLLAIVDAQRAYAASDADGNGVADYAASFISSPGKKNGLYWETKGGEAQSPLGPLIGHASAHGYKVSAPSVKLQPYNGYYYRIIAGQGKNAPGGAYDYRVGGRMFGGFAVVAYPANYGLSGVKTFMVNHDGVVFEKDLGAATGSAASAITLFNPDTSWQKVQ